MIVVADITPLISLMKTGKLGLLMNYLKRCLFRKRSIKS